MPAPLKLFCIDVTFRPPGVIDNSRDTTESYYAFTYTSGHAYDLVAARYPNQCGPMLISPLQIAIPAGVHLEDAFCAMVNEGKRILIGDPYKDSESFNK